MSKAYKGTNKNAQCRGFQYEVGKEYKTDKSIGLCSHGFHACENPFDIFSYYPPDGNTRFFEVEQSGDKNKGDDKTVSSEIKIKAELTLKELFTVGFKMVFEKVHKSKKTKNTSGYHAHANTSGFKAHANTSGSYAHANTSGFKAHANTSGDEAHANTSGFKAHANTSGYHAHANTSGDEAIACSLGVQSKAMAVKGWIVLVDWQYIDNKLTIKNIHHAKVGRKIKGVKIKPNTCYWFENGVLNY